MFIKPQLHYFLYRMKIA